MGARREIYLWAKPMTVGKNLENDKDNAICKLGTIVRRNNRVCAIFVVIKTSSYVIFFVIIRKFYAGRFT